PREGQASRCRPAREDVPAGLLEGVERRQSTARVQGDRNSGPTAESAAERQPGYEELPRPASLKPEHCGDRLSKRTGQILVAYPERTQAFLREIDASERQIPRWILQEVDELKAGADRVAHRHE